MKPDMKKVKVVKNRTLMFSIILLIAVSFIFLVSCGAGVSIGELTVYTLTITNNGNGTTVPSGSIQVNYGVAIYITAVPDDPYFFLNWTIISGSEVTFDNTYAASTTVTRS